MAPNAVQLASGRVSKDQDTADLPTILPTLATKFAHVKIPKSNRLVTLTFVLHCGANNGGRLRLLLSSLIINECDGSILMTNELTDPNKG